ncbi:MAG TPA: SBBP repeat-containing protein [Bacteroidia bacterium]|nr:SBBP repeat-containing protein [Bacteroidia bacterium]
MKKMYLALTLQLFSAALFSQQYWQWGHEAGGAGNDEAMAIATDPNGYSYVTGYFNSTASFGPNSLTSSGGADIFVAKYSPGGTCLWVRGFGGVNNDAGHGIALDAAGNCYVTGDTGMCAVVRKYNSAGNVIWTTVQANAASANCSSRAITTDSAGNSWITGYSGGGAQLFGSHVLNGPGGYVVKFDTAGVPVFATKLATAGAIDLYGVTHDAAGNCYATGYLQGQDNIGSLQFTSTGSRDAVLIKVDTSGNFEWLKQSLALSGGTSVMPNGICADKGDGIYFCGDLAGKTVFGNDTLPGDSAGGSNIFIVKYDTAGTALWAEEPTLTAQGPGQLHAYAVATDTSGNAYMTGVFSSDLVFGSTPLLDGILGMNTFIVKFEPNAGTCQFTIQSTGSNPGAFGLGISTDSYGGVYIAGFDKAPVVFGSNTTNFIGGEDIFVARIAEGKESGINETDFSAQVSFFSSGDAFQLSVADEKMLYVHPTLNIYDMTGRLVKTIAVNELQTTISSADLAPGIYSWELTGSQQRFASGKTALCR